MVIKENWRIDIKLPPKLKGQINNLEDTRAMVIKSQNKCQNYQTYFYYLMFLVPYTISHHNS